MLPKFELHIPDTIEEACRLKKELGPGAEIVAGGTDVYAKMHNGGNSPAHIIDLKNINELKGIKFNPETGLRLGVLVTHHEIETSVIINKYFPVLAEGAQSIGSLQVRNRGTMGGNICTAAPSADGIGPLMVLEAVCEVQCPEGKRTVALEDFFTGPKRTVLKNDEILTGIKIPPAVEKYGSSYFKYGRRNAMEIALLGISVYLETEKDNKTCRAIRIALGTSAPTPIRARDTESFLLGKDLTDPEVLKKAGKVVLTEAKPRSSWRSSAEFRRDLLEGLVPRTIREAFDKIRVEGFR